MRTILAILAAVVLAGCAMTNPYRDSYLASNPDLDPEIRRLIADGKIRRGMTKDQVRASWGNPCGYCYGTRQSSWGDTWEYNIFGAGSYGAGSGTLVFFDEYGTVSDWSN